MTSKEISVKVRFSETSAPGIVHHSNYVNWFDMAQAELFRELGYTYEKLKGMKLAFLPVEMNCKYYSPAYFEDELSVRVDILSVTNIKIVQQFTVTRKSDGNRIVVALLTSACVGDDLRPKLLCRTLPQLYAYLTEQMDFGG